MCKLGVIRIHIVLCSSILTLCIYVWTACSLLIFIHLGMPHSTPFSSLEVGNWKSVHWSQGMTIYLNFPIYAQLWLGRNDRFFPKGYKSYHNIGKVICNLAWHIDASSVVWTSLLDTSKLATQIARLVAIVEKQNFEKIICKSETLMVFFFLTETLWTSQKAKKGIIRGSDLKFEWWEWLTF